MTSTFPTQHLPSTQSLPTTTTPIILLYRRPRNPREVVRRHHQRLLCPKRIIQTITRRPLIIRRYRVRDLNRQIENRIRIRPVQPEILPDRDIV